MGRGVAEIANLLSFPELFLILRRAAKHKTEDLRFMAVANVIAAGAPWSKEGSKQANELIQSLDDPTEADPRQSAAELTQMFVNAGIPVKGV